MTEYLKISRIFLLVGNRMIEDIFDQACTLGIDRLKRVFRNDTYRRDIYEQIATPLMQHIADTFSNYIVAMEIVGVLVVVNTCILIMVLWLLWNRR